ncbi:MAG TPA: sensor histidine kinase [Streptosporangiaceae bacterium]|jgi:signal transduction histidine kinase
MTTPIPGASPPDPGGLAPGRSSNRLLAARDAQRGWTRRHPRATDAVLAAVVLLVSLPPFTALTGGTSLTFALVILVVVPLAWRRRWPFAVLLVIMVPTVVQLLTNRPVTDFLAFLIIFYTITACSRPRLVLVSILLLEAGVVVGVTQIRAVGIPAGHTAPSAVHGVVVWALASGLLAIAGLLGYYVRTNRQAQAAAIAEQAEQAERERQQQAQLAASAERARIAREMHDIVAHNIAVMIALADGAAYTAKNDPDQAVELMGQVSTTGRTALTEMRRLLGVLRQPAESEQGPQPTLADLDKMLGTFRAAGLAVELTVAGEPFPLPPSAQLAVYRMITEALTNTLKHAAGSTATVCLEYRDGEIELEVSDDGAGRGRSGGRPGPAGVHGGHGITGMRERAAVFGGQVSAGPRSGGGWRVRTTLHVEKESA